MTRKIQISRQTLERLYYEQDQSQREIAEFLGCSETTVARRLREYGMPTRRDRVQYRARSRQSHPRCQWAPDLAYAVGLVTSDGSLSSDGRHIVFTSVDYELIETFKQCLGLRNRLGEVSPSRQFVRRAYRVQFSDVGFYDWLLDIGLTPAKRTRLGALSVPDGYFADFVRGFFDGDGSIYTYTDRYNAYKGRRYEHLRLYVNFCSTSQQFLEWLRETLRRLLGTLGGLCPESRGRIHILWRLKYAKGDSLKLLPWMYYHSDVPCLHRKRVVAEPFLELPGLTKCP
jgi:intein-encoded DNA endonuclease-like protein